MSELQQTFPIRKHCSDCGRRIKDNDKFYNFAIHAINGTAEYTVGSCCKRDLR